MRNLTGQRFGRLTVIEKTDKRLCGQVVWRCHCDCGNVCEVITNSLTAGKTKSCGCLQKEKTSKDLTGQRFGRLTVIEKTDKRSSGRNVVWKCRCDCGNECEMASGSLRSGNSKSCGCLRKKQ